MLLLLEKQLPGFARSDIPNLAELGEESQRNSIKQLSESLILGDYSD